MFFLLFQEPAQPSISDTFLNRVLYYLNYRFVNQDDFKLSVLSMLLLVLVCIIAVFISRYVRRLLQRRLLPKLHLDPGFSYTLLKIVHYLIIVSGGVYALKVGFSIDLTGLAVLVGFLSVGIGFGLQYIASDIVSGLILLFERPVRINDRLSIGDVEGRVESIRVRSTSIVTNDKVTVIVPNSELVRNQVINWSLCNEVRLRIKIGVAYGSDVDQVIAALKEAARGTSGVLDDPAPNVHFADFGESSLDFDLLIWVNEPHKIPQIKSDVRYHINKLFLQYNIEIPFPQRDLHLRSGSFDKA